MRGRSRSPSRLLAPLAIIAFLVAFVIVLSNSGATHSSSGSSATSATTSTTPTTTSRSRGRFAHRRTYTVRAGDTLGAIAIRTGVSVSTLEDLNPGLDPTGLVAGQKIKLR
jgi:LysM repeat protein